LLDLVLAWSFASIAFSAFAIGGTANAFNLIDGVNGLASGSCIIVLSGLALVAWRVGDVEVSLASVAVAAALAGFFFVNFPMGKLFLGDAGAYFAGFVVAALTIALVQRNEAVSPMLGLLALCYPVTETVVSIQRRIVRQGSHPGQPDRLHLHSLIYRSRAKRMAQFLGVPRMRSALAGLMLMALPLLSTAMMVQFYQSTALMALCCAVIVLLYLVVYRKAAILRPIMSFSRVPASSRV
jgi:UDP-N-acetylmuramyl pentapeptide phosphotransferase/UDP-N-acetylglucosamine-1-phosphate transferase